MSKLHTVDDALAKTLRESIDYILRKESSKLDRVTAAALSNYQPSTRAALPGGVGYSQSPFIATTLLPEVLASPDGLEQASYPTWGKEAFFVADDIVAISAQPKATDLAVSWTNTTLDVHAKEAAIDEREMAAANAVNINIVSQKTELCRTQVETRREYLGANLLTTTSNYASSSHYETLGGTGQWSHASSAPIAAIINKAEFIRSTIGRRPNFLWLSPTAFKALRFHASITDLIKYTGQKGSPGAPASIETLAALFNMNVVVGDAVYTSSMGGAFSDVWNDCAGLVYVESPDIVSPKFGMCLTSAGYPQVMQYRDDKRGARGSEVVRYIDAYKFVVALSSAGYLWSDVTA